MILTIDTPPLDAALPRDSRFVVDRPARVRGDFEGTRDPAAPRSRSGALGVRVTRPHVGTATRLVVRGSRAAVGTARSGDREKESCAVRGMGTLTHMPHLGSRALLRGWIHRGSIAF